MKKILCPNCKEELTKISICIKDNYNKYEFEQDGYYHLSYACIPENDKIYVCDKCNKEILDKNIIDDIECLLIF